MIRLSLIALLLLHTFSGISQPAISEKLQENIRLRVANGLNTGMIIGLIDSNGVNYYNYGVKSFQTNHQVDEETIFEIGSVSKVFTGILLADQVNKGLMSLDDPIDLYLPDSVKAPTLNGEPIRLVHLSNHTSGLPRLSTNFEPENPSNPYSDYSEMQLYEFLNGYELTRAPGSGYEYSNYAVGLLGHLLATKNGISYEELMLQMIAKPLGLKNTKITLNSKEEKNLAVGHNMGHEVENWDLPILAGAGALRSTASDMIKFLEYNMGLKEHQMYEVMQSTQKNSKKSSGLPAVGLGWHRTGNDADIIWHNGGTGGYRSFVGFSESEKRGVVILTNSSESVDDLGFRILNPQSALRIVKPSIATEISGIMDEKGVEVGINTYWELKEKQPDKYEFGELELQRLGNIYQVKNEFEKAIALLKLNIEVYPNSSGSYSDLGEAYFKSGNKEEAIKHFKKALAINPANTHAAMRLEELSVDISEIIEDVIVDEEVLESYVGKYELAPGFIVTITREEDQLSAQATGQQKFPIYPKSKNVFYFKVVEAQLTFNSTEEGLVKSVTLLQGGREIEGKKL